MAQVYRYQNALLRKTTADKANLLPPPVVSSFVASTRDTLFLWGGGRSDAEAAVYTYSVNTETWLRKIFTRKKYHPTAGLWDGGCTLAGQCIYFYGGFYGGYYESYYSPISSFYKLKTDDFTWSKLSNEGGPIRKTGCRMIAYKDEVLLVVGGQYKSAVFSEQPGSRYEIGYTNELHSYSLYAGKFKHVVD